VKIEVEVFWVMPSCSVAGYQRFGGPCCVHDEDGGSRVLLDVDNLQQNYLASQPRTRRPIQTWLMFLDIYGVITNDVSDYINLLVRIARIICNHLL